MKSLALLATSAHLTRKSYPAALLSQPAIPPSRSQPTGFRSLPAAPRTHLPHMQLPLAPATLYGLVCRSRLVASAPDVHTPPAPCIPVTSRISAPAVPP